eukprot:scaffold30024_cov23-Tisochrysis_lutea.AAC.3
MESFTRVGASKRHPVVPPRNVRRVGPAARLLHEIEVFRLFQLGEHVQHAQAYDLGAQLEPRRKVGVNANERVEEHQQVYSEGDTGRALCSALGPTIGSRGGGATT